MRQKLGLWGEGKLFRFTLPLVCRSDSPVGRGSYGGNFALGFCG